MKQTFSVDELAARITRLLPDSSSGLGLDVQKNLKAVLAATLAKMDLVTREEFDVQTEVLARTRARLEELEQLIADLEKKSAG